MKKKTPNNDANEPSAAEVLTAVGSLAGVLAAHRSRKDPGRRGNKHVSRQPSNPGRRKGSPEGPGRLQARDRGEVRRGLLHHQRGWAAGAGLALRGMAARRGEAGAPLELQSRQEEAFESHQLLRPGGGDRRPGPSAAALVAAPGRAVEGGSGGAGHAEPPGSAEHGVVPQGDGREPVHGRG